MGNDTEQHRSTPLHAYTSETLAATFPGTDPQWWRRHFPTLRERGVLFKRGRKHFGRPREIEDWLREENEVTG